MNRLAKVYLHDRFAGNLRQYEDGYSFIYDLNYLQSKNPIPISLTFPLREESYQSNILFPFFDGLIPEGWYVDIENTSLNPRDRMGLLLSLCKECVGAVSIVPMEEVDHE
jgi:serine/threonine-protein kinase HipA